MHVYLSCDKTNVIVIRANNYLSVERTWERMSRCVTGITQILLRIISSKMRQSTDGRLFEQPTKFFIDLQDPENLECLVEYFPSTQKNNPITSKSCTEIHYNFRGAVKLISWTQSRITIRNWPDCWSVFKVISLTMTEK